MKILVLPGDGIGPRSPPPRSRYWAAPARAPWSCPGFRAAGYRFRQPQDPRLDHARFGAGAGAAGGRRGDGAGVRVFQYPPRDQGGINPTPPCASSSTFTPMCGPAAPAPVFPSLKADDLVIVRENTEGFFRPQHVPKARANSCQDEKHGAVHPQVRPRLHRNRAGGFRLARERKRKVSAVHKANVVRLSDGLFCARCARSRPNIPTCSWKT